MGGAIPLPLFVPAWHITGRPLPLPILIFGKYRLHDIQISFLFDPDKRATDRQPWERS